MGVDEKLLGLVRSKISSMKIEGKVILRSSTNCEDLPGFNGAGLYRSIILNPNDEGELAEGIKKVWSSVWLERAYNERDWYQIDHSLVAMAILVQPLVGDLLANGVAITKADLINPLSGEDVVDIYINSSPMEHLVTAGDEGSVPEQAHLITRPSYDKLSSKGGHSIELVSLRKGSDNVSILSGERSIIFGGLLAELHNRFLPIFDSQVRGIDVEFLIPKNPDDKLVLVQVRPLP